MAVISRYTLYFRVDKDIYILLNSLTGAIDIADEIPIDVLEKIEEGEIYRGDLYHYLKERGYIFDSSSDEEEIIEERIRRWEREVYESPLTFVVGITTQCNFACRYCFQRHMQRKTGEGGLWTDRKIALLFNAMDNIVKEEGEREVNLSLFGGEPLLPSNKCVIKQILDGAKERCFTFDDVITNGYYLTEYVPLLKKYDVRNVQVVLDGTEKIHNFLRAAKGGGETFDKVTEGIDKALREGIHITLRINVNGHNIQNLPDLAKYIIRKGWDRSPNFKAHLGLVYPYGFDSEGFPYLSEDVALKYILEMYDKDPEMRLYDLGGWTMVENILSSLETKMPFEQKFAYCGANTTTYAFDPYGKIYACFDAIGIEEMAIGEYWPEYSINVNLKNRWRRNILEKRVCGECRYGLLCGGGCIFHAVLSGKDFSEPMCPQIDKSLRVLLNWYYRNNKSALLGRGGQDYE